MSGKPDLTELLANEKPKLTRPEPPKMTPEVAKLRRTEIARRSSRAVSLASKALRRLHKDDWNSLFQQAAEQVAASRGPLPGDPGWSEHR